MRRRNIKEDKEKQQKPTGKKENERGNLGSEKNKKEKTFGKNREGKKHWMKQKV